MRQSIAHTRKTSSNKSLLLRRESENEGVLENPKMGSSAQLQKKRAYHARSFLSASAGDDSEIIRS